MVSPGAGLNVPDGVFAPYEIICELGSRPNPVYAARTAIAGGKSQLVVAERFAGAGKPGDARSAEIVREARRISTLASPNVARVREVAQRRDDLAVFTDFVEGEKLAELWRPGGLSLEIALRVIIDALSGLSALHNLRDAKQQPMNLVHGEVSPATIVFGLDGVSRLVATVARRVPGVRAEDGSLGYLAPEVHAGEPYDARADVFCAGVLLWEALSGKRLFPEGDPAAILARLRAKPVPVAPVPEKVPWARGLVDVAARALAASPSDRWPTAAAMAAEIRKLAGLKLAPASTASAFAKGNVADRVKARRERLERTRRSSRPAPRMQPPVSPALATTTAPVSVAAAPAVAPPAPRVPAVGALGEAILVAPGVHARVADAIEIGSESDLKSVPPDSIPPDPIEVLAAPLPRPPVLAAQLSPPPVPTRTGPATPATPAVSVVPRIVALESNTSTDPLPPPMMTTATVPSPPPAAPVEVPISIYPVSPYEEPTATAPAIATDDDASVPPPRPGARRRRAIVLGSVGAMGVLVFGLAAWRAAHHGEGATHATAAHSVPSQTGPRPAPAASSPLPAGSGVAAAPSAPAATPSSASAAASPPAASQSAAAPRAAAAAAAPAPPPKSKTHSAAAPAHAKPAAAPSPARPKSKAPSTFDPNSL